MKELCNELIARRLRQLNVLRERRREIVAEQHFFRNHGSAVAFTVWMAEVAPKDTTLDAVVQTELAELDVGDIETRLLGTPLSRVVLSPTVKQESASASLPSASAANARSQLEGEILCWIKSCRYDFFNCRCPFTSDELQLLMLAMIAN